MRSGVSRDSFARRLLLAAPLVFLLLSGCDTDGYPADLKYPLRGDVIIGKAVEKDVGVFPEPPGQLFIPLEREPDDAKKKEAKLLSPSEVPGDKRTALIAALETHFGTPANPLINLPLTGKTVDQLIKEEDVPTLKETLDLLVPVGKDSTREKELAEGSKLYRRHCLHCHGVTGDGRGPTGPWLHPHPRDYRKGLFKFVAAKGKKSAGGGSSFLDILRPNRTDLLRILRNGVDGTSMPSFHLLQDQELERLVSYVIHLALRGEVEETALKALIDTNQEKLKNKDDDQVIGPSDLNVYAVAALRDSLLEKGWGAAARADAYEPTSPADAPDAAARSAAISKGFSLFVNKDQGGCLACHVDYGRNALYRYDAWGTLVRPRDLSLGQYRGGRRPIDLFWRIKNGIRPSTMPAIDALQTADEKESSKKLSDQLAEEKDPQKQMKLRVEIELKKVKETETNIWHVIEFVQAVPYPKMLPADVREKVYPTLKID